MNDRQLEAFWSTIKVLDETSTLPHVMVIGSWAEFLYAYYFNSEFLPNIRTRDIDFLYPNIRKPAKPVQLERKMVEAGFTIARDTLTEVVKMFKEDLLEIEFITRQVGASGKGYLDIPGIGIRGQSLRDVNILAQYPLLLSARNFDITVPEPAVYTLQKMIINSHRIPASKREKDIESIRNILPHIKQSERDMKILKKILNECTKKEINAINTVCDKYSIELPKTID